jgi:Lipid A 3-O-deacylase (PagL)
MKRGILLLLFTLVAGRAHADELALELGPGFEYSLGYNGYFLQYYRPAPQAFGHDGFYQATLGHWPSGHGATIAAISRGLRWNFENRTYARASLGAGYLDHTTDHLGTHAQFLLHLGIGREYGDYDFCIGAIHVSNGKKVFHWNGSNDGENFLTFQVGRKF